MAGRSVLAVPQQVGLSTVLLEYPHSMSAGAPPQQVSQKVKVETSVSFMKLAPEVTHCHLHNI